MDSRFIRPDVRTLTISHGDTLVVRARLTAGERRARFARMYLAGVDGKFTVNPMQVGLSTITAYLLDWSLRDHDGQTVAIRDVPLAALEQTLDQLAAEDFDEIRQAIDAHEAAMDAERAAEKKTRPGVVMSLVTSSSPPTAAGATSGSVTSTLTSMSS